MEYLPIRLKSVYRDYVWGGSRLKREYGKEDAFEHTAESWELSCLPGSESRAAEGEYAGMTLCEIAAGREREFFGSECPGEFPLLVKLIDAEKDLSVQVHPSDETACPEKGERGKAEMWYVVDAAPGASLYMGFQRDTTEEEFRRRAAEGSICDLLNEVRVQRGDAFFIAPGTVHAIRGGLLIAEIQQSSDTTFRIYDYGRPGSDGKPRELHLESAARVTNYRRFPLTERQKPCGTGGRRVLAECPYFRAEELCVCGSAEAEKDESSFRHLLCTEGEGSLRCGDAVFPIRAGDSYFLPAAAERCLLTGQFTAILSGL